LAKEYPRAVRVGEQIQRELADIIRRELHDPHVGMVTITSVDVSPDLSQAKAYFTVLGDDARIKDSEAALKRAAGFMRHELGGRLRLRMVPQLRFVFDESERRASRVEALIAADKAKQGSAKR
jgi:ribosome-binding factor A